jgi:hypothetical protein
MDNSVEYINMCKKAVEVQNSRKTKITVGDYYYSTVLNDIGVVAWLCGESLTESFKPIKAFHFSGSVIRLLESPICAKKLIWLPRQDQLQGMIDNSLYKVMSVFYDWITDDGYADPYDEDDESAGLDLYLMRQFNSMEQLWFVFVMKEKYNRIWRGDDWIILNDIPIAFRK